MPDYRVVWEIEVSAETPQSAARQAFEAVRRPDTMATVFDVTDENGEQTRVDLLEAEQE